MAENQLTIRRDGGRARCAFTLMELIIVIGIIWLVIAIALPTIANIFAAGADSVAYNLLAAHLTTARARAIERSNYIGVHMQMVDVAAQPDRKNECYVAVFFYDQASGQFKQDNYFLPQHIPGNMAFGELNSTYVDSGGKYQNTDDPSFTSLTVLFSSNGAVVKRVGASDIEFDSEGPLFSGDERIWDPSISGDRLGATAITVFNHRRFASEDWDDDGDVDAEDGARYLDLNAQFLPINCYTGQLERR
jgi:Tfp pilus assembly protein FimT